ncbi:hypothetical protein BST33_09630 [Mycolicibacter minnesotensis]|uniref:Uncharacterized protein n=1 Tax=Mycolicibacter minnesotensis TaxID=1118379 RepID=A0A7I7R4S1_9MYCO|nr:hypothetical protein [Mycolicibacter minnesotensis]ORB01035.1 hypothetical protein BST33_09630 [Mycolicibacter minnesotensis]BBY33442.1 hypothetical protein MMIN_15030 [Mycolicibacter minnesotensis]
MTAVFIAVTLMIVTYSLWVRRDTWWSRWEAGATLAIALQGCALLLLTPWAGTELGPPLHSLLGLWNVQQVLGWLCLIAAVIGNIYHMLVRLADPTHVWPIMRNHLLMPVGAGVAVVVVAFANAKRGYEPDMYARLSGNRWVTVVEVTSVALMLYLAGYVGRLMVSLRHDQRARTTLALYAASMAFGVTACVVAVTSSWVGGYAGPAIWAGVCASVAVLAYGLARSWQAKKSWFAPDTSAPRNG